MDKIKTLASGFVRSAQNMILELNFYRIHLASFVVTILVSSVVLWISSTDPYHVDFTNALTICASAMTNCGLTNINLSSLNGYQQSILFALMLLGDLSVASTSMVYVRRYFFRRKILKLLKHSKAARRLADDIEGQRKNHTKRPTKSTASGSSSAIDLVPKQQDATGPELPQSRYRDREASLTRHVNQQYPWSQHGYGGFPAPWQTETLCRLAKLPSRRFDQMPAPQHHYLSFAPELDHKGRFNNLTSEQLGELGGVEYRALKVLSWLLPCYTLFWLCFSWAILLPYSAKASVASEIKNAQVSGTNPQWWALFAGLSAYSNAGLTLLDSSMIPLRHDYLILIITGAAILGGNTFYPIFLRLSIWTMSKLVPKNTELHHSLAFLLHHPRRCFLFLFPAKSTWYLLAVQIALFLLIWLAFEVLNIGHAPLVSDLGSGGLRIMDGLYQVHGVRSSGFYITNQSNLSPACQIFFMVNMYISAIPFIVSLRSSNIYEERSLGKETDDEKQPYDEFSESSDEENGQKKKKKTLKKNRRKKNGRSPGIQTHLQNQLAYDLWWIVLAVWLITIIEQRPLTSSSPGYSMFSIMFEVVSAYGTVGLSLGLPYDTTSFCGAWHRLSKLILITVMLRGRHRILPAAIDRAALIPGQELMDRLDSEQMLDSSEDKKDTWNRYEEEIRQEEEGEQAEQGGRQDPEGSTGRQNTETESVSDSSRANSSQQSWAEE